MPGQTCHLLVSLTSAIVLLLRAQSGSLLRHRSRFGILTSWSVLLVALPSAPAHLRELSRDCRLAKSLLNGPGHFVEAGCPALWPTLAEGRRRAAGSVRQSPTARPDKNRGRLLLSITTSDSFASRCRGHAKVERETTATGDVYDGCIHRFAKLKLQTKPSTRARENERHCSNKHKESTNIEEAFTTRGKQKSDAWQKKKQG
jgi:hypothetical protein